MKTLKKTTKNATAKKKTNTTTKRKATKKAATKTTTKKKVVAKRVQKTAKRGHVKKTCTRRGHKKNIIITSPVDPNSRITVASELADDDMLESDLLGKAMPYFIYQFCEQGCEPELVETGICNHKKITGMTAKGVNEVVRLLNQRKDSGLTIRLNPAFLKVENDISIEDIKGVQVSVYAENLVDGDSAWGVKFESYTKIRKRDNKVVKNDFALEKALSKAERNAKRKLIPESIARKMMQELMKNPENVKVLKAPTTQASSVAVAKPMKSSTAEVEQLIRDAIMHCNDIDRVSEFDEKTKSDKRFSKKFKAEIRKMAAERVDHLQNK